ncbi:2-oxoacid dehydrogenases acyltransferase-domain-containing protein [Gorgonomyces haynaldii]|nr:2-oxoacid dehydrogenases acyltransferase-domain-containing protein [Gorgonomyces haynaldii]
MRTFVTRLMRNPMRFYATYPQHTIIRMPALSPTMTHGNLGDWLKQVGDEINPGDVLVGIETDKAQMDFECQDEGFIAKILLQGGQKEVEVNTPLAVLVENKDDIPKFADFVASAEQAPKIVDIPAASAPAAPSAATTSASSASTTDRVIASPLAKTIAKEKNIDLTGVQGTGPNGRIVKQDVLSVQPQKKASAPAVASVAPASANYKDIPTSNIRKIIADRLTESKSTIPHYYLTVDLNADKILKLRQTLNKEANGKYKLSVNDFVIKASSLALIDVPEVNSSWQESFIRQYNNADIAVAVATETGLITPIVKAAEQKGLVAISQTVKNLAEKGKQGKLAPHEYQGGSFSISNLGMYDIQHFTAIINPPHAAILAVGGVQDKLVLDNTAEKGFRVQKTIQVTLSNDHRVVDGAVGAKFLQRFKYYFENPLNMLL